jgi:hypothetical protein
LTILWRGISKEHPSYAKALQGKAEPRGGHDNTQKHNGGDTKSIFTSWTRDKTLAENYATKWGTVSGVVLEKDFSTLQNQLVLSEDMFYEDEVLVVGIVENAKVHLI